MKMCAKCGEKIPNIFIIDGVRRNTQRRKYCLKCSPFGLHNTCKIHIEKATKCVKCGRDIDKKCHVCYFNERHQRVKEKVQSIVGDECWLCGYNRCWRNICFHHVDPSIKTMGLSGREYMLCWEKVYAEMQKCALLCHLCHGEVHEGIIANEIIVKMHKDFWDKQRHKDQDQTELN